MLKLRNKYFILRHGETVYQTKKKDFVYPSFPEKPLIKLTKRGQNQIKTAAKKLKKAKIDLIFSSDIFRARQTAEIAAKELERKVNFDKRLRDINLGTYHGKTKEEFYCDFPRKRFYQRIKEGEGWNDVKRRIVTFIKEIDKKFKNKNILIVSHGDPLWLLEGAVKNWSIDKLIKIKEANFIKTGEIRELS